MKNLITIKDLGLEEIRFLLDFTERIKKHPSVYSQKLRGKTLGLIFEKASTRTWASFHVGMVQMGGNTLYLGPQDIEMGKREEVRDIARVLSSY
ncbi:MAG TPA: ornithine carbamoyltransferase, partial [Candidatus Omnitrophota bacterium]|nr:ornithine carbamoyltransferase [Candidatus Omnitrophota bacterium]